MLITVLTSNNPLGGIMCLQWIEYFSEFLRITMRKYPAEPRDGVNCIQISALLSTTMQTFRKHADCELAMVDTCIINTLLSMVSLLECRFIIIHSC